MDDGTVGRLAEQRFLITTTTARAVGVYQRMHFCHQVLWPELDVQFVSVTDQWAQFAVAGPRSRELLERVLDSRCDISNGAFPYMANGAITLANGRADSLFSDFVFRRTGLRDCRARTRRRRRADQATVRSRCGHRCDGLWARIAERNAGREGPHDRQRVERPDDGLRPRPRSHVFDAEGLHRRDVVSDALSCSSRAGRDFTSASARSIRKHALSGWHALRPQRGGGDQPSIKGTSRRLLLAVLNQWIGLGLLRNGPERHGEHAASGRSATRGESTLVEICAPVFVDPEGARLRV